MALRSNPAPVDGVVTLSALTAPWRTGAAATGVVVRASVPPVNGVLLGVVGVGVGVGVEAGGALPPELPDEALALPAEFGGGAVCDELPLALPDEALALPAEFDGAVVCDGLPLALPDERLALPAEFDVEEPPVDPLVGCDGDDVLVGPLVAGVLDALPAWFPSPWPPSPPLFPSPAPLPPSCSADVASWLRSTAELASPCP
jgi:hypothetical protein